METIVGKQSIQFQEAPHIVIAASVVGKKESEGPLGKLFDQIEADPMVGQASWEEAESALQKKAALLAMEKAGSGVPPVRYLFSGDLLGQLIATSFGVMDLQLPLFGLYGACSTIGEALMLGAMTVQGGYSEAVLALTSSHFGSAEKQFRYPLEYGGQRNLDGHRERRVCTGPFGRKSAHHRSDSRESDRLWPEGFYEYGSLYGARSL